MAVHAHPDDESSKGAATLARYAAEGVEVLIVSCTGGERGDVLNPNFVVPEGLDFDTIEGRRAVRAQEMAAAAAVLGVRQMFLGFTDSGFPSGDPRPPLPDDAFARVPLPEAAAPLVEAVRRFRPHVITTYDESGGYPHPDHIYCHTVSVEAWEAAGDPARYVIEGGAAPWSPLKLYYMGMSMNRWRSIHEAMVSRGVESPYGEWVAARAGRTMRELPVTARLNVAAYFPQRDAALVAHASQIDPGGFFFAVPRDLEAEVWPWDDFDLAASRIPGVGGDAGALATADPTEDDLFAGIRGTELAR
jgi:mycothiol S-conjugate amidase